MRRRTRHSVYLLHHVRPLYPEVLPNQLGLGIMKDIAAATVMKPSRTSPSTYTSRLPVRIP